MYQGATATRHIIAEKSWLRWIIQRERRASKCLDQCRLVLGRGLWSKAKWQVGSDCDAGRDGHKTALEPAYLGIEGRGTLDADGCEGDGGAGWEDELDPWGLDPLSVRVCEMAGDARGVGYRVSCWWAYLQDQRTPAPKCPLKRDGGSASAATL